MSRSKHLIKRIVAILLCLCLLPILTGCSTESQYQSANKLLAKGEYAKAAEKLEALGSFEDAPLLTMYAKAAAAGESGQYAACLQAFTTLGDFKDSQLMYDYYVARSWEEAGLLATTPTMQATQESWDALMKASELYGQQLLFRDSQQRQQNCWQAVYDMAEGLAEAELFAAARDAHYSLVEVFYKDSRQLGKYYAARHNESLAPSGVSYDGQWKAQDFEAFQRAAMVYDEIPLVRDSMTRATACRKAAYDFAKICAADGDYANASVVAAYASGYLDADNLTLYYAACAEEAKGHYAVAAEQLAALGDYAPEGMKSGAAHAQEVLQAGYDAAMAQLEEGLFDEGYALLLTLGAYNNAMAYPPQHQLQRAQAHMAAGEYEDALDILFEIDAKVMDGVPGYTVELGETTVQMEQECFYRYGESLFASAQNEEELNAMESAIRSAFVEAGDYAPEDGVPAGQRLVSLWYERGENLLAQQVPDYDGAMTAFLRSGEYAPEGGLDGTTAAKRAMYLKGDALLLQAEPDYDGAKTAFAAAQEYAPEGGLDGTTAAKRAMYLKGETLLLQAEPDYDGAKAAFAAAQEYAPEGGLDGTTAAKRAMYLKGDAQLLQPEPDLVGATESFRQAADYAPEGGESGVQRMQQVWMLRGEKLLAQETPEYDRAKIAFTNAGGEDGNAMAREAMYLKGNHLVAEGSLGEALFAYRAAQGHPRAMEKAALLEEQFRTCIDAGTEQAVGLKNDGTIMFYGEPSSFVSLSVFRNLTAVATGGRHVAGLNTDGTVLAAGFAPTGWTDVTSVVSGEKFTLGLKADGTFLISDEQVHLPSAMMEWKDIAAIDVTYNTIIGLKKNGTVVASHWGMDGEGWVEKWNGITQITTGGSHTVGLKKDGTVVAVGDNSQHQCDTAEWEGIVAVAAGSFHTVGLKANGTVVAVGWRHHGQLRVDDWTDVVAIAAAGTYTMGLKADGTILFTGQMDYEECDFSHWRDIGPNVAYVQQLLGE